MKSLLILSLVLLVSSCGKDGVAPAGNTSVKTETSELNSKEVAENKSTAPKNNLIDSLEIKKSSKKISWDKEWSYTLDEVLSSSDLSQVLDVEINESDLKFVNCPNYNQMSAEEKKIFLIIFISAISEAESDFEIDNESYNKGDSTNNIGLLQIDVASAKRHSGTKYAVKSDKDLKDPNTNLKVGAHIFKNQITGSKYRGRLFPSKSYYWQVLTDRKSRILKNINLNRDNIKFCSN